MTALIVLVWSALAVFVATCVWLARVAPPAPGGGTPRSRHL